MKFLSLTFLACVLFFSDASAQEAQRPPEKSPKRATVATNEKISYQPDADLLREMRKKVRVVESKRDWAKLDRQRPVGNAKRTRSAYIAQFKLLNEPDAMLDVIVVHLAANDKFYEIRGIDDFPWRPFSDFKWLGEDILQFEQWVNPNNGGRYQVNLKTGKLIAAGYVRSN